MSYDASAQQALERRYGPRARASADLLKKMVRLWGGTGQEKKADCLQIIEEGLADPARVRAAVTGLEPEARAALALLQAHGGSLPAGQLDLSLRAYGYELPEGLSRSPSGFGYDEGRVSQFAGDLIRRGLLVLRLRPESDPAYGGLEYEHAVSVAALVGAEEQLLAGVDWSLEVRALPLPTTAAPSAPMHRSRRHVLLDLMAIPEAVAALKRLTLTKAGDIRAADLKQFTKRLGWEKLEHFDGYLFPAFPNAVISAFFHAGWLVQDGAALVLAARRSVLAAQPLAEQVRGLMYGFGALQEWSELPHEHYRYPPNLSALRFCLLHLLRAWPPDNDFRRLDDFLAVAYDRIGEFVYTEPDSENRKPYAYGRPDHKFEEEMAAWREGHRGFWIQHERAAIQAMLTSWLYWLGLVEVGNRGSGDFCFRLTGLGRAVLQGAPEADAPGETSDGPAWVVQPNYDLIVYLERARPADLAFLERHAERRQAEPHVLHYQLTRESVYRGLESGTTVEEVLDALRWGSGTDLPQNVEREIREWGEQRERVTIHRKATLIAFPDAETRARALAAGLPGRPVGDRYILTAPRARIKPALHAVYGPLTLPSLDYADRAAPCLSAAEDGTLKLVRDTGDLLLPGQLANCAEPVDAKRWRITPASLAKVRRAGVPAVTLLDFLRERLVKEIPPLLEMALRNALGSRSAVQAESGLVLRVTDKALYTALTTSPTLQPLLLDVPGPDTLVISREHEEEFRAHLEWLGVRLTTYARATDRPDWLQTIKDARSQKRRHRRYY